MSDLQGDFCHATGRPMVCGSLYEAYRRLFVRHFGVYFPSGHVTCNIMPALNVRDFPADLLATLKGAAEAKGTTLRDYCILVLGLHDKVQVVPMASQPADKVIAQLADLPLTTASQLPTPSGDGDHPGPASKRCGRCDGVTIPWSPGWRRCKGCGINWPA